MTDIVVALLILAVLLGFIALLGHGIWLMVATILRAVFGAGGNSRVGGRGCPQCGGRSSVTGGVCARCGYRTLAVRREDLSRAMIALRQLHGSKKVSDSDFENMMRILRAELGIGNDLDVQPRGPSFSFPTAPSLGSSRGRSPLPGREEAAAGTSNELSSGQPPPEVPARSWSHVPDAEVLDAELVEMPCSTGATGTGATGTQPPAQPFESDESSAATPASRPFSPGRAFANMLQSFMEEKNIRWGELASGMLIVGSAIGLVVSLRTQLQLLSARVPYFPAVLLMLGTLAIHAAGIYTLRRWRLRSTSRGVLIIATLLVPLSFVAGILLSGTAAQRPPVGSLIYLTAVTVGLLGYGAVMSFSAHALFPVGWWRFTVAVMGTSAGQLVINRMAGPESAGRLAAASVLFALPLASYLIATLSQLRAISEKPRLTPARAAQTFTLLGIALFSLIVPLCLQAELSGTVRGTFAALSPSLSVAAAVILGMGTVVQRRCKSEAMSSTRVAGTSLALMGGLMMLGAVVAAWPMPPTLIAVASVTAFSLAALAMVGRLSILHAGAVAAASFAALLLYHHLTGRFESPGIVRGMDLIRTMLMGRSAIVLLLPGLLSAGVGLLLLWKRCRREGLVYLAAAAGVATTSLAIALFAGFSPVGEDANLATIILVLYALAALVLIPFLRREGVTWVGSSVLLVALVHLYCFNTWFATQLSEWQLTPKRPLVLAILMHGALVACYGLGLHVRQLRVCGADRMRKAAGEWTWLELFPISGALTVAFTVPFILTVSLDELGDHAGYAACVAVVWAIAGFVAWEPRVVTAAHAAGTVAVSLVVAAIARGWNWPDGLHDLRHWQLQLSVLGVWCLLATAVRLVVCRWRRATELLRPPWPSVDQLLLGTLIAGMIAVGMIGCGWGVCVELGMWDADGAMPQQMWHSVAYELGSWVGLCCICAAVVGLLYERITVARLSGLVIATAAIPLLISGRFEVSHAVASALRWSFAIYLCVWVTAMTFRARLGRMVVRIVPAVESVPSRVGRASRDLAMFVGIVPVLFLTAVAVERMAYGAALNGPEQGTLFDHLSSSLLYGGPMALLVAGMVVMAVRDGSRWFALLGSLLVQYLVALSVSLPVLMRGGGWTLETSVSLVQWSACSLAAYTLTWQALSSWIDRGMERVANWQFRLQFTVAVAATATIAFWIFIAVFFEPGNVDAVVDYLGSWPSYLAAGLASFALFWYFRGQRDQLAVLGVVVPSLFATLVAATSNAGDPGGEWLAYNVLTASLLAVSLGAGVVHWWQRCLVGETELSCALSRAATVAALAVLLLFVRGGAADSITARWTLGTAAGLFIYFAGQAIVMRRHRHAYLSAFVGLFATSLLWWHLSTATDERFAFGFVHANVLAASVIGLWWLLVELWHQHGRGKSLVPATTVPPVQLFLANAGLAVMILFSVGFAALSMIGGFSASGVPLVIADAWGLAALLALGVLLLGLVWDERIGPGLVGLYVWGFLAIALGLNVLQNAEVLGTGREQAIRLVVVAALAGAAHVALAGHLWENGSLLVKCGPRLRIPRAGAKLEYVSRWLPSGNVFATVIVCGLGLLVMYLSSRGVAADVRREVRMSASLAPLMLAYGVSCLAQGARRSAMQCLALFLVVLSVIFIGWADVTVPPGDPGALAYCARLLSMLAGMTLIYGLLVTRFIGPGSSWFAAVRRTSSLLAVSTVGILLVFLLLEVALFEEGIGAPIATPEVVVVSVMLFGFLVTLLMMAVLPGRDPLGLTEKGRQGYVYAGQVMAALLCAHIYLSNPELFQLGFMDYWPYLVMGVAFGSVAFGEFCFRNGWRVVAEPLQRTGGFLPLLPALAAWTFAGESSSYPLTLLFGGLVYVFVSISRRSFLAGAAAAMMGNGALWALLVEHGLVLTQQPQLWMIPPAVSVLVASQLNRERLSDSTLATIRYMCVMIIYLSSTGEMFIKLMPDGAHDWIRPLILTSLSVGGIFAGIALRVRGFLYLGSSFLFLSLVAMVWNAQRLVDHSWPWWVFGISLGLAILAFFGLFEKYRREMQQLIVRLRQWEP